MTRFILGKSYHKATVSLTSKTLSLSVALHDLMTSFVPFLHHFCFLYLSDAEKLHGTCEREIPIITLLIQNAFQEDIEKMILS